MPGSGICIRSNTKLSRPALHKQQSFRRYRPCCPSSGACNEPAGIRRHRPDVPETTTVPLLLAGRARVDDVIWGIEATFDGLEAGTQPYRGGTDSRAPV